ncbi:hypothetical protein [Actinokineospora bangkokensis]|nr:hypothetical protein [Actinokineospora bangkokensis]
MQGVVYGGLPPRPVGERAVPFGSPVLRWTVAVKLLRELRGIGG